MQKEGLSVVELDELRERVRAAYRICAVGGASEAITRELLVALEALEVVLRLRRAGVCIHAVEIATRALAAFRGSAKSVT